MTARMSDLPAILALLLLGGCAGEPADDGRVSRPGEYTGYSEAVYDGHEMSSFYIEVRDGTRLTADLFRPTLGGVVADEPLPVLWMHTPHNRRTYRGDSRAARRPRP